MYSVWIWKVQISLGEIFYLIVFQVLYNTRKNCFPPNSYSNVWKSFGNFRTQSCSWWSTPHFTFHAISMCKFNRICIWKRSIFFTQTNPNDIKNQSFRSYNTYLLNIWYLSIIHKNFLDVFFIISSRLQKQKNEYKSSRILTSCIPH